MAVPLQWVGVQAEFLAERFGIKRPALDVGDIEGPEAPELRQVGVLLRDRNLEMMARGSFVQRQCLHSVRRQALRCQGVDVKDAGP